MLQKSGEKPVEVGSLSQDLQVFYTSKRWFSRPIPEFAANFLQDAASGGSELCGDGPFPGGGFSSFVNISVFGEHFDMLKKGHKLYRYDIIILYTWIFQISKISAFW